MKVFTNRTQEDKSKIDSLLNRLTGHQCIPIQIMGEILQYAQEMNDACQGENIEFK